MWGEEKKANYIKHATREYNIQRTLHHPRLVALNDVFEIDVNSFCTVLEYADGTDLDQVRMQHFQAHLQSSSGFIEQVDKLSQTIRETTLRMFDIFLEWV